MHHPPPTRTGHHYFREESFQIGLVAVLAPIVSAQERISVSPRLTTLPSGHLLSPPRSPSSPQPTWTGPMIWCTSMSWS